MIDYINSSSKVVLIVRKKVKAPGYLTGFNEPSFMEELRNLVDGNLSDNKVKRK